MDQLLRLGLAAMSTTDYRLGLEYLRAASDADPAHSRAAETAGAALLERKHFKEAVAYLERAVEVKPRDSVLQLASVGWRHGAFARSDLQQRWAAQLAGVSDVGFSSGLGCRVWAGTPHPTPQTRSTAR